MTNVARTEEDIRLILSVQLFDGDENPLTEFGAGARAALLWVLGEPSRIALSDPAELRARLNHAAR